jgi:glycosyltransferase involved in cell wall biosynthesis
MHCLAVSLAARGMRVRHIVFDDHSLPRRSQGVELIRQQPMHAGDGLHRRVRYVVDALARADGAVYVQRSAGSETGVVGLYARSRGRQFILSTSWDGDLSLATPISRLARVSYRVGRRLATVVVVQTESQLAEARSLVDVPVHLIRSFAEPASELSHQREAFLWVGRIAEYKDPLSYLELAERLPDARFWMVATDGGPRTLLSIQLRERAERLPNLQLLEPRPREELFDLYRRTLAVVNTSTVEGFPNTLLEGWSCGAAALSLRLDPDGVIARYGLGATAGGSIDTLETQARELWASAERLDAIAANARRYLREVHSAAVVGAQWAELIATLLA